jgi:hypothetical protein
MLLGEVPGIGRENSHPVPGSECSLDEGQLQEACGEDRHRELAREILRMPIAGAVSVAFCTSIPFCSLHREN